MGWRNAASESRIYVHHEKCRVAIICIVKTRDRILENPNSKSKGNNKLGLCINLLLLPTLQSNVKWRNAVTH